MYDAARVADVLCKPVAGSGNVALGSSSATLSDKAIFDLEGGTGGSRCGIKDLNES